METRRNGEVYVMDGTLVPWTCVNYNGLICVLYCGASLFVESFRFWQA